MFLNHGWEPGRVCALSPREKICLLVFARKEIQSRQKTKGADA